MNKFGVASFTTKGFWTALAVIGTLASIIWHNLEASNAAQWQKIAAIEKVQNEELVPLARDEEEIKAIVSAQVDMKDELKRMNGKMDYMIMELRPSRSKVQNEKMILGDGLEP